MTAETDARIARLLHHRKAGLALGDPVVPPISLATTFHLPEAQGAAHYYGRSGQPTWDAVETQLAILENAETVAFPSGMAAITAPAANSDQGALRSSEATAKLAFLCTILAVNGFAMQMTPARSASIMG